MGLGGKKLEPVATLLYYFAGDIIVLEVTIKLLVTMGARDNHSAKMINFFIVKEQSSHDVVFSRPML